MRSDITVTLGACQAPATVVVVTDAGSAGTVDVVGAFGSTGTVVGTVV
jgi:hypothetical protein